MATIVMADDGIAFDGLVAEEGPLGGAETAFSALAEALARRGHQVGVWNHCSAALSHKGVSWTPLGGEIPKVSDLYIGNRGHHLQDSALANNQGDAGTFFKLINSGNGFNYVCSADDAKANGVPYPYQGFCAPAIAAIAPFPQIAAAETTYWFYPTLYYVGLPLGQSSR